MMDVHKKNIMMAIYEKYLEGKGRQLTVTITRDLAPREKVEIVLSQLEEERYISELKKNYGQDIYSFYVEDKLLSFFDGRSI